MTESESPLLQLSKICKNYPAPGSSPGELEVLSDIDLELNSADAVAVTGPSGSGKSTLLNIIGTLDTASSGSIYLDGRELSSSLPDRELAELRNRNIGFVFQLHHLLPQCTVLENVLVPALPKSSAGSAQELAPRARELLGKVGLDARVNHRPGELSGGERQRVAVVRALINSPKLLLIDEATGSLDRASSDRLIELLLEINSDFAVAMIFVTHDEELAGKLQKHYFLKDGKLLDSATL